jgi:hypothetical protein
MVALLIISLSTVLSLRAIEVARRVAATAEEVRGANVLLGELLDTGPRVLTVSSGATNGFAWTIETQPAGSERPVAECRRLVTVTNVTTARRYSTSTLEACPPEDA